MSRPPKYTAEEGKRTMIAMPEPSYQRFLAVKQQLTNMSPVPVNLKPLEVTEAIINMALVVLNDSQLTKHVLDQVKAQQTGQEYELLPRTVSVKNRSHKVMRALDETENTVSTRTNGPSRNWTGSLSDDEFVIVATPAALKACRRLELAR